MVSSVVAGMRYFLFIFFSCVCAFALMLHVCFYDPEYNKGAGGGARRLDTKNADPPPAIFIVLFGHN